MLHRFANVRWKPAASGSKGTSAEQIIRFVHRRTLPQVGPAGTAGAIGSVDVSQPRAGCDSVPLNSIGRATTLEWNVRTPHSLAPKWQAVSVPSIVSVNPLRENPAISPTVWLNGASTSHCCQTTCVRLCRAADQRWNSDGTAPAEHSSQPQTSGLQFPEHDPD
jgi:hypothetical protein